MRNVFDKQRILSEPYQLEKTADVVRLTSNFLSTLPDLVERAHAKAMLAHRRQMMGSLECELRRREIEYQLLSDWTLLAKVARSEEQLLSITPRTGEIPDLFRTDFGDTALNVSRSGYYQWAGTEQSERAILPEQHHAAWLGETDDGNLKALLLPYPADQMRMWEISPRINSPKNDDPSLWEPVHAEPTQTRTDDLELLRE
jgi:hypothetical protein